MLTYGEGNGVDFGGEGQLIQRAFGVSALPLSAAVLVAGIESADIPDSLDGEVVQYPGLGTQTETAPFVIVMAVALEAVVAAGGLQVSPLDRKSVV